MRKKTTDATPTPLAAQAAILQLLHGALRRRIAHADRATLAWFDNCRGRPDMTTEEGRVAAFANENWRALRALLNHRNELIRLAAMWAMATTRRPDVVEPMLALLLDQRSHFDHDFAYDAALTVGEPLVAPLEQIALRSRGMRRTYAIECLGMTRAGKTAVAALGRIVRRLGFTDGVLNALYNVAHVGVVPIAAKALASKDPAVRGDALGALLGGFSSAKKNLRVPRRRELVRSVLAAIADPRTWRLADDPWATLLGWGTEVLELLGAPGLLPYVRRCRRNGVHPDHEEELAQIEHRLLRRSRPRAR